MPSNSRVVFICYRRSDSDALAGRLRDRMQRALPDWTVFMDVNSVRPGLDFRVEINAALRRSSVFILLVGHEWLAEANRLLRPDDPVLHEIRLALALELRLLPVLANDAKMPNPEQLPEEIRPVAWLNAVELRHSRFEDDFRNLMSILAEGQRAPVHPLSRTNVVRGVGAVIIGALLAIAIGLVALVINFHATGRAASEWIGDDGAPL